MQHDIMICNLSQISLVIVEKIIKFIWFSSFSKQISCHFYTRKIKNFYDWGKYIQTKFSIKSKLLHLFKRLELIINNEIHCKVQFIIILHKVTGI